MNKYFVAVSTNLGFFAISSIFFIVITPLAIKIMGQEFYGLWAIINGIMLFSYIGALNIGVVVNKFGSETTAYKNQKLYSQEVVSSAFLIVIAASAVTSIMLIVSRSWLVSQLDLAGETAQHFKVAVLFIAGGVLPQFIARMAQGYLNSQLRNKWSRSLELGSNIVLWLGAVAIAYYEKNLILISVWCLTVNTLTLFVSLVFLYKLEALVLKVNFDLVVRMLKFSFFGFFEVVATALFQQFDRIVVAFILGPAAAGIYSVGSSISLRLSLVTLQVTDVLIPYTSSRQLTDMQYLYQNFRRVNRYVSSLVAVMACTLILWLPELLAIWISPRYSGENSDYFRYLVSAYVLLSLGRPGHQTLTGLGKVQFTSFWYLITSIAMLISLYVLGHQHGFWGVVIANFSAVLLLVYNLYAYRILNSKIAWGDIFLDLGLGLLMPIAVLIVVSIESSVIVRIMLTILPILIVGAGLSKDEFLLSLGRSLKPKLQRHFS